MASGSSFLLTILIIFLTILFIYFIIRYVAKKNTAAPVYLHGGYIQTGLGIEPHLYLARTGNTFTIDINQAAEIETKHVIVDDGTDNTYMNLYYYDQGVIKQLRIVEDTLYQPTCDWYDYLYNPACWTSAEAGYYWKLEPDSSIANYNSLKSGTNYNFVFPPGSELVFTFEPRAGSTGAGDYVYVYSNNSAIPKKGSPSTSHLP